MRIVLAKQAKEFFFERVGSICTEDPETLKGDIGKNPRLKYLDAVALNAKTFEEYSARRQESLP